MTSNATSYGITGYGGYVPRLRMQRSAISAAHRWMAPGLRGKGHRAFCSWDEDSITMAVEAARDRKRVRQMDVDSIDGDASGTGDLGHHP